VIYSKSGNAPEGAISVIRIRCVLVYIENFSNQEAAAVMKKSLRQIENLLYQAKRSLRSELEKEGFVYENL